MEPDKLFHDLTKPPRAKPGDLPHSMAGMRLPDEALRFAELAARKAKREIAEGEGERIANVLYSAWITMLADLLEQPGTGDSVKMSGAGSTCLALLAAYFECAGDWDKMQIMLSDIRTKLPEPNYRKE
jgi:hypothetical protein